MQVNVKNVFNNVSRTIILKKLCDAEGPLANIILFTRLFYGAHYSLYYQHGQHVQGVTIIIDNFPLLGNTQVALNILFSCVTCQTSYFTWTIHPSSFLSFLASFDKRIMQVCADIIGPRSWEFFQGPFTKHQA